MWKINLNFISKNLFEISPPIKSYGQNSQRRIKISNGFLEIKFRLIFHINLVQLFLKNFILLCLNKIQNSTLNTIRSFDLTMSG